MIVVVTTFILQLHKKKKHVMQYIKKKNYNLFAIPNGAFSYHSTSPNDLFLSYHINLLRIAY